MSKKTFCDKCGAECENKIGRLLLSIVHETKIHEEVGEDIFTRLDLCGPCTDIVRNLYGFKVYRYPTEDSEPALVNERFALSPRTPDYPPDVHP